MANPISSVPDSMAAIPLLNPKGNYRRVSMKYAQAWTNQEISS